MNERYQKNTAPSGKTRRSAASAKPKRDAAESGASAKAKAKAKAAPARTPLVINPPTPEFKFWRRTWWMLLVASFVFTLGSVAVRSWLEQPVVATVLLVVGYAGIFAALYLDWFKLRRLRKDWMDLQKSGKVAKTAEQDSAKKNQ